MASLFRDRPARRAARWLAPSIAAACAGALAAGVLELTGDGETGGALGIAATIGFVALVAVPLLLVASAAVRAVVAGWQPRALAAHLIEDGGGAPLLAAWVAVIWLAAVALAGALFAVVWVLSAHTAWKAITVSLVLPVVAVVALAALVAFAWPAARGLAWLVRRADAGWRRAGRRSLLTPRWIALGLVAVTAGAAAAAWILAVAPRIGPFDLGLFTAPALALVVTVVVHAIWPRLAPRARAVAASALAVAALAAVACAVIAARAAPSLTLSIWGDRPVAGLAIDKLYSLDELRAGVSLAELAPTIPRPGARHPDIILITIDTVRADHTPPYGGVADMPGLKQLGAVGAVFDWAFSPSNVTRRSIPAMVVGLQSNRVHGRVVGWALRVDPRHVLLAERLQEGGYDTAGFMCCEGFWGTEFHTGLERGLAHLEIEKNGIELAKRGHDWLTAREAHPGNRPLFVWMHILEPHNWINGTGEGVSHAEKSRMYDRSLALSDEALVELLSPFSHRSPADAPIVIVTADHGEALDEHGSAFHSSDLYDSQTRVPFVIAGPGIHPIRIPETVSLVDLLPTVMDLAGFEPPHGASADGRSLADLVTGARAGDPEAGQAFIAQIKDRSNPGGITVIVRGRWKLIHSKGAYELYDTRADPGEHTNLVADPARAGLLAELRALLGKREAMGDESPFP